MSDERVFRLPANSRTLPLMSRAHERCPRCEYPEADVCRCVRRPGILQRHLVCRACGFDWLHVEDVTALSLFLPLDVGEWQET